MDANDGTTPKIESGSTIYIHVSGHEEPLLIDNTLMESDIYDLIKRQLQRRNFKIIPKKQNADYILNVIYRTKDVQVTGTEASTYQYNDRSSANAFGYGILAALAVSAQSSSNGAASRVETTSHTAYRHTIGLYARKNKNLIWSAESTWENNSVDISYKIVPVSQILLSELPGYDSITPHVKALNPKKMVNYFNIDIKGFHFTGPALPYKISFQTLNRSLNKKWHREVKGIERVAKPRILPAVLDLIQTAEYAVPLDPDYKNPLSNKQWAKVELGGDYYIGNDDQKSYILVDLRGEKEGYTIKSAKKVSRQKYNHFLDKLQKWQNALADYYQVFE